MEIWIKTAAEFLRKEEGGVGLAKAIWVSYECDTFSGVISGEGWRESPVVEDGWTRDNMLSWLTAVGSCWTHSGVGVGLEKRKGKQLEGGGFLFDCSKTRMMHLPFITSAFE